MRASVVARETALWLLSAFLVYVFVQQGVSKFSDSSGWAKAFVVFGYPVWFRILIGVAEVTGALLLLYPRTATAGGAIIVVVMLGGMGTHVWRGHPEQVTSEIFPLILASIVAFGRRKAFVLFQARGNT